MSWREMAAAVKREQGEAPRVAEAEAVLVAAGVPADMAGPLLWLETAPPPRRVWRRDAWHMAVADAMTIARNGWAGNAIRLGWSPHDLFGIAPYDEDDFSGLAVWLKGRRLLLLDEKQAIATSDERRFYFNRAGFGHGKGIRVNPVLLWEFGRDTIP